MSLSPRKFILVGVLLAATFGCDSNKELVVPPAPSKGDETKPLDLPKAIDLTTSPDEGSKITLDTSAPKRWRPCEELFEPEKKPLETYPYQDTPEQEAEALYGCDILDKLVTEDGRRYLAYEVDPGSIADKPHTIRTLAYGKDGKLRWSHDTTRNSQGSSFVASYRGTTIADVSPHLICINSMWESGVDVECLKDEDATIAWEGRLPYWSGVPPQGFAKSLFVADLSGLRQIYPWSGVERRFKKLEGPGGRSSYYETDNKALYFSSNRTAPLELSRYDFATMTRTWSRELPGKIDPIWSRVFPEHDLLIVRHEEQVIGLDTRSGSARWVFDTGELPPKIAATSDTLLVLIQREDVPNLLLGIDPESGERRWWTEPPSGTLRLEAANDLILLGSVRAVQRAPIPATKPGQ